METSSNEAKSAQINHLIPDFQIEVYQAGKFSKKRLSDYRGRWLVLFFYPADFTFVCPTELEELAANQSEFDRLQTSIVSISTDTVFVHKAWHDSSPSISTIKYEMGADPTGQITRAFGVYIPEEGLALRGTFIVDPDGHLIASEVHDNSIGRNATELLRKLEAAQYVRAHQGEVCPASWRPGAKTLTPNEDLVGKI